MTSHRKSGRTRTVNSSMARAEELRARANFAIVSPGEMFLSRRTYLVSESCLETVTMIDEKATSATVLAVSEDRPLHHERSSASSSMTNGSNQKANKSASGRPARHANKTRH